MLVSDCVDAAIMFYRNTTEGVTSWDGNVYLAFNAFSICTAEKDHWEFDGYHIPTLHIIQRPEIQPVLQWWGSRRSGGRAVGGCGTGVPKRCGGMSMCLIATHFRDDPVALGCCGVPTYPWMRHHSASFERIMMFSSYQIQLKGKS